MAATHQSEGCVSSTIKGCKRISSGLSHADLNLGRYPLGQGIPEANVLELSLLSHACDAA